MKQEEKDMQEKYRIFTVELHDYTNEELVEFFQSTQKEEYLKELMTKNKGIIYAIYDEDMDRAKLEWKAKEGALQHKYSLWVSRKDAEAMCRGDYTSLKNYSSPEALRFYSAMTIECYRPAVIVEYNREAFTHPLYKTRITIDSQIRASETECDLFKKNIPMVPVLDSLAVLEVKYNGKLPLYISKAISSVPHVNSSVSKYCGGRNIIID